MNYNSNEIQTLNLLSDNKELSSRFQTPKDLTYMAWAIVSLFVISIICAIVFEVDKIVPAKGVVETKSKLFHVRSTQDSFINAIHVVEGQQVLKGQTLLEFDSEPIEYEISSLEHELKIYARDIWSELYKVEPVLDKETINELKISTSQIPDFVSQQGYQYALADTVANQKKIIEQSIKSLHQKIESNRRLLSIANKQKQHPPNAGGRHLTVLQPQSAIKNSRAQDIGLTKIAGA